MVRSSPRAKQHTDLSDEANLTQPVGGYTVVDLDASFRANNRVTLFALVNNAFDKRFDTYGHSGRSVMCRGRTSPEASTMHEQRAPERQ